MCNCNCKRRVGLLDEVIEAETVQDLLDELDAEDYCYYLAYGEAPTQLYDC